MKKYIYKTEQINNNKNADKLFKAFLEYCDKGEIDPQRIFTIEQIANILPRGISGVSNYATYGFSLMSMFSNQKGRLLYFY